MKLNHFNPNMSPNKRPIPREHREHAPTEGRKYRIHHVGNLWYLCDTLLAAGEYWHAEAVSTAQIERTHGWTRLFTLDGRYCTDAHAPQYGHDTFEHAHSAYLSQIS